jgi:hypothetical protein
LFEAVFATLIAGTILFGETDAICADDMSFPAAGFGGADWAAKG